MIQAMIGLRISLLLLTIFAGLCGYGVASPPQMPVTSPAFLLRARLHARIDAGLSPTISVHGEALQAFGALDRFYVQRAFQPAWICDEAILPHTEELVRVIRQTRREGIHPSAYHLSTIEALIAELDSPTKPKFWQRTRDWIDLELLLTDAYFLYGTHALAGRVNPRALGEVWFDDRPEIELAVPLQQALESGSVGEFLRQLQPAHRGYAGLQQALALYREVASRGGWPLVPDGPKLQRGDSGS